MAIFLSRVDAFSEVRLNNFDRNASLTFDKSPLKLKRNISIILGQSECIIYYLCSVDGMNNLKQRK